MIQKRTSLLLGLLVSGLLLAATNYSYGQSFIRGKVTDESGELPGINISIKGTNVVSIITEVDGSYNVEVQPGKYRLSINALGYRLEEALVTVVEGESKIIDFQLSYAIGGITQSVTLTEQNILDAPATVHVVSREQIIERGYTSLQDVLDDIPEVEIQKKSMVEFRDNIGFRGVTGNEKFLILMDGIRISAATGDPHSVHYNFSVMNAERVEVVLGPASAVYGVDAFSGVVNIITRKGDKINGANIYASYGSFNTTDNALEVGGGNNEFSFSILGSMYQTDEPDFTTEYAEEYAWFNNNYLPNGEVIAGNFADTINIAANYPDRTFNFGTNAYFLNAQVRLKNFELGYMRNGEMHSSSTAVNPKFSLYTDDARYGFSIETVYGKHLFASNNEKWQVVSIISLNSFETNPESLFRNVYTNYEKGYKYQYGKTKKIQEQIEFRPSETVNIVGGFSYEDVISLPKTGDLPFAFDKNTSPELQGQYYLGTNQIDSAGNDLSILQDFYFLQYQNIGGFLQGQIKFSEAVELTLGARYDYNTRYGTSFNPRLGLVIKPTNNFRLKLLYGESFLSPSPWKAFSHYGAFIPLFDNDGNATGVISPFFHLPNPDLEPEKLRSFEAGASVVVNQNIIITFDGYYNQLDNLINYFTPADASLTSFQGINVDYIEVPSNQGEALTYGGTLGISANQPIGEMTLDYYAYYSYMDGELDGNQLPYTAQNTVKAGFTLSAKRFSLSPRLTFRTTSYSQVPDGDGGFIGNDAITLLNLNATIKLLDSEQAKIALFAKVYNLLNTKYYNVSNIGSEGFALTPQDPLRATFGINASF